MDYLYRCHSFRTILLKLIYFYWLASFPRGTLAGYLGWIFSNPLHQSDSAHAVEKTDLSADTTPGIPAGLSRNPEEFNVPCQISGKSCGRGRYCDEHYGKCERIKRRGDFCRKNNHCQRRHECVFGRCRKEIPKGQEGARCSADVDCSEHHCCARQHGELICKPRLRLGMQCFVPAGGLDYSLNEQCPCENNMICQYEPVRSTTQSSIMLAQKNEWFQFTTDTAQMKCMEIGHLLPKTSPAFSAQESDGLDNNRDDDATTTS